MGVILHTLLVGEPPMNADAKETKAIIKHRRENEDGNVHLADFGGWDRISKPVRELVVDMLKLDPKERLGAEQVYNEIDHIIHQSRAMPGKGDPLNIKIHP